jgi:hypothetical protein
MTGSMIWSASHCTGRPARQDPDDRRKNVVGLTDAGRTTLREASSAIAEAERLFLGPLSGDEATQLKNALHAAAFPAPVEPVSHQH